MEFDPKIRLSLLIKLANNGFEQHLTSASNDIELTSAQCQILGFIHSHEGKGEVNPIDIEHHYHLTRPTVSGILQRLERKGFIALTTSEKDRRYKQIKLTPKAREHHDNMMQRIFATEEQMFKDISLEDIEKMRTLLMRMISNLSNNTGG